MAGLRLLNFEKQFVNGFSLFAELIFLLLCAYLTKQLHQHIVAEFIEPEIKWNGIDYYLDSKQGKQSLGGFHQFETDSEACVDFPPSQNNFRSPKISFVSVN